MTSSGIIRKRCRALMAKMPGPKLSSSRIAAITGCSRNFVDSLIHVYNYDGIDSVLATATIPGRPGRLKGYLDEISKILESEAPRSCAEAAYIIRDISGISFSLTWIREIMHRCGFRFINKVAQNYNNLRFICFDLRWRDAPNNPAFGTLPIPAGIKDEKQSERGIF